jgi:hypothetical protein
VYPPHDGSRTDLHARSEARTGKQDAADAEIAPIANVDRAVAQGRRRYRLSGRHLGVHGGEHHDACTDADALADSQSAQTLEVGMRRDQRPAANPQFASRVSHQHRKRLDRHVVTQADARRLHDHDARVNRCTAPAFAQPSTAVRRVLVVHDV